MKKSAVLFLLCLTVTFQTYAEGWGTVLHTDKEIDELDRVYSGKKIIVENYYYPKPGKFDEVLALRTAASELLKKFGFTAGRITVTRQILDRERGRKEEVSAVVWRSEYENLEALKKELNSYTTEYERQHKEIQAKMTLLTKRFKRTSSYVLFN